MKFTTNELQIIETLLSNLMNVDYDPDIKGLLHKVRKEINDRNCTEGGIGKIKDTQ